MKSVSSVLLRQFVCGLLLIALVCALCACQSPAAPVQTTPVQSTPSQTTQTTAATTSSGTLAPITLPPSFSNGTTASSVTTTTPSVTTPASTEATTLPKPDVAFAETKTLSEELKNNGKTVVRYNLKYPTFASADPAVAEKINAAILEQIQLYADYCKSTEEFGLLTFAIQAQAAGSTKPYTVDITYKTVLQSQTVISVVFDFKQYDGTDYENRFAMTFSAETGERLNLSGLLTGGESGYYTIIFTEILGQIQPQAEKYYTDYASLARNTTFHTSQVSDTDTWYCDENGFVFFYETYVIADKKVPLPTFSVPYTQFAQLLRFNPAYKG